MGEPADAGKYLAKAREFGASASMNLEAQRWNAAGLDAIHAGISAADAALIASAGLRSASQDHNAITSLLEASVPATGAAQVRQLTGLLGIKNDVAYERRLLTEAEARTAVDQASRLLRWAGGVVAGALPDA